MIYYILWDYKTIKSIPWQKKINRIKGEHQSVLYKNVAKSTPNRDCVLTGAQTLYCISKTFYISINI